MYFASECHQVCYYTSFFTIRCNSYLFKCLPGAGLVVSLCFSHHSSHSPSTANGVEPGFATLTLWGQSLHSCPLAYVASIGKTRPFKIMGESVACLWWQSSLLSELRLKAIFHNRILTPRFAEYFQNSFLIFPGTTVVSAGIRANNISSLPADFFWGDKLAHWVYDANKNSFWVFNILQFIKLTNKHYIIWYVDNWNVI